MKKVLILALTALLAGGVYSDVFDTSGFSKMLEIKTSSSSMESNKYLNDFQALVRLSSQIEGFSYSDFKQSGGGDLAFLDEKGNLLAHEVDTWNTEGESLVWVKIPLLARDTKIYMVYGNASYSNPSANETWNGYVGVWHMKEASGVVSDSTGNSLDAVPSGARAEYNVGTSNGVVGMARMNGATAVNSAENRAYLLIPNYDSFGLGDTFTVSGFFTIDGSSGWYRIFSRIANGGGWGQEVYCNNAEILYPYGANAAPDQLVTISGIIRNWVYLTFVYNGNECKVYRNGEVVDTVSISPASDNGSPLAIGCTPGGDEWALYGSYDEVRLADGTLSDERIAADYATIANEKFFSYGAVEQCSLKFINPSDYSKCMLVKASSSALPMGDSVKNFPALVRLSGKIEGFEYSDFKENGADLVFADKGGRVFACEVDTWNTDGESLVWVRVPNFENGMELYAYWGGDSVIPSTSTWSDFTGVWHMNESGVNDEIDVSGNGLDARAANETVAAEEMVSNENGAIGLARVNISTPGRYNCLWVPSYPAIGSTFTVSGWFNATEKDGWHRLLSRKPSYGTDGWEVEMRNGSDDIDVYGSGETCVIAGVSDLKGSWNHLVLVYCDTKVYVYQNGEQIAEGNINPVEDFEDRRFAIGNNSDCDERSFVGSYDEVRLGKGALSCERIAADYATVTNKEFFSYSAVTIPEDDTPVMGVPVMSKSEDGKNVVAVAMLSGKGKAAIRFTSSDEIYSIMLSEEVVEGFKEFTFTLDDNFLAKDKTYSLSAVGVNAKGGERITSGEQTFYSGNISVEKTADGKEDRLVDGVFTVSRADTYGEVKVNYSLGGSAVAGVDYAGESTGTVTIPAGSTSATISITPKMNSAVNEDTEIEIFITEGFYLGAENTATMTIVNLPPPSNKDFRKVIKFTMPMDFLEEGEILEDFPVLIKLSSAISGFSYNDFVLEGGKDMMFTDASGKIIASEINSWDDTGVSYVWVCVPKLTKNTVVKMYYGNGVNCEGIDIEKWAGYLGVWHMEESSDDVHDSTSNNFNAQACRNERSREEDQIAVPVGAVGAARRNQNGHTFYDVETYDEEIFATARRNYLSVSNTIDDGIDKRFSFSGWFKTNGGTEWNEYMVFKRDFDYHYGWSIKRVRSTIEPDDNDETKTVYKDKRISVHVADAGKEFAIPDMISDFVHIFVSFDFELTGEEDNPYKSVASVYANGEFVGTVAGSTRIMDNDYPLTFGHVNSFTTEHSFYGQYDELRFKRGASTMNWAKAEYLTVKDPSFTIASKAEVAISGMMIIVR
ncbi:MAG: DUF2341 domain-containing protein [Kiritimatiellae bacterium]|nr:DUF2341 domain-containing protein [Kiritimatiellia bacterium]